MVGQVVSHYRILAKLGGGGMGVVYRAEDTRLGRAVALKFLPPELTSDATAVERLEREARAASGLNHQNICTIYEIGEHDGRRFIAMELVEGETLRTRTRTHPIPIATLVDVGVQMADALETAHASGVIHRDLKPENIMLTSRGQVKVLDFGLAKPIDAAFETTMAGPRLTDPGTAVGTVAYMSPEQARGEPLDARSDLFSFGLILYEMATGHAAFSGTTTAVIFDAILNREVAPASRIMPAIPAALDRLVARALAKDPARRPRSAREMLDELGAIRRELESGARSTSGSVARVTPSIAVLPFADMSAQKDQDYFCEGMAEELINALTKLPTLRVASRTSSFRFKGAEDVHTIGERLGVETILEGSVRTAGKRLRVTAQLITVADGYHLWSERYDRQMEDVFEIQDDIALAIVTALKVKLFGEEQAAIVKHGTDNIEAHQLCLKARYYWHRWTDDGFRKAAELFEQARQADPGYALASFGLGDGLTASAFAGLAGPEARPAARHLLETAVSLDPELAEARAVFGIIQGLWDWNWPAAEESITGALATNPRSAHAHSTYALHLLVTGRGEEAARAGERSIELDPLSLTWNAILGLVYYGRGDLERALRQAQMTLELEPGHWLSHETSGLAQGALGKRAEAVAAFERAVAHSARAPYCVGHLGFALARDGRRQEAEATRRELLDRSKTQYIPPVSIAFVSAGLDEREEALAWLERGCEEHDPQLACYLTYPLLDDLRSDPRFGDLVRRVGVGVKPLS